MNKELAEFYINYSLNCGVDFSEIFYEERDANEIKLREGRIDVATSSYKKGLGIRLAKKDIISYGSTNNIEENNVISIIDNLKHNYSKKRIINEVKLKEEKNESDYEDLTLKEKKDILYKINSLTKKADSRVDKVIATLSSSKQKVIIANSKEKYVVDNRNNTILIINVVVRENGITASSSKRIGYSTDALFLRDYKFEDAIKELVNSAIMKLGAINMEGGVMPVVIGPGFGAVIFHEAVGHALEATTVADKLSVVSNKYNKKIATDKVTLIDDGTLENLWGTTYYDDEGNKTKRNILIDKGILTSYLIDELNSKKMKMPITGSGRRQNYKFIPTSRMNNTYLMPGNDSIDDMIKSIKYGLYAKEMGGGSVDPVTGDFNFTVEEGYIIRNGKICEIVKLVSLIGNTLDILKQVEMVSDNLSFGEGFCGSISGLVNTTIGEPTIKISKILVGGGLSD